MMQHKRTIVNQLYKDVSDVISSVRYKQLESIGMQNNKLGDIVGKINSLITNLHNELNNNADLAKIQNMFSDYTDFQKKYVTDEIIYVTSPVFSLDVLFSPFATSIKNIRSNLEQTTMEETYNNIKNTSVSNIANIVIVDRVFDVLLDFLRNTISYIPYYKYTTDQTQTIYTVDGDAQNYKLAFTSTVYHVLEDVPKQQKINLSHINELDLYLSENGNKSFNEKQYEITTTQNFPQTHAYFLTGGTEKEAAQYAIFELFNLVEQIEKLHIKYRYVRQTLKMYIKNERRAACYLTYLSYVVDRSPPQIYTNIDKKTVEFILALINNILEKIHQQSNEFSIKYFDNLHFFTLHRMRNMLTFLDTVVSDQKTLNIAQTTGPILNDIAVLNHFQLILNSYNTHK